MDANGGADCNPFLPREQITADVDLVNADFDMRGACDASCAQAPSSTVRKAAAVSCSALICTQGSEDINLLNNQDGTSQYEPATPLLHGLCAKL